MPAEIGLNDLGGTRAGAVAASNTQGEKLRLVHRAGRPHGTWRRGKSGFQNRGRGGADHRAEKRAPRQRQGVLSGRVGTFAPMPRWSRQKVLQRTGFRQVGETWIHSIGRQTDVPAITYELTEAPA